MQHPAIPYWVTPLYPVNHIWENPKFRQTIPAKKLAAQPLGFVDVGARGGIHDLVAPIAAGTAVLAFEPDVEACRQLNEAARSGRLPWARLDVLPVALAERKGPATLYRCVAPTNDSLLPVNQPFIDRYRMEKFAQAGTDPVVTETLDDTLFNRLAHESWWGEFIKLDTQGTELEILNGGKRTLSERTVAIFVEVEFCQIYAGQKLFADVELALRELCFSFMGFHSMHERARKSLNKQDHLGRERLLHADAVFFKDPLPGAPKKVALDERGAAALFVCALILGYFDFALEIAEAAFARDRHELALMRDAVFDISYHPPEAACQSAHDLATRILAEPGFANVAVGRFVDERRPIANFEDVRYET